MRLKRTFGWFYLACFAGLVATGCAGADRVDGVDGMDGRMELTDKTGRTERTSRAQSPQSTLPQMDCSVAPPTVSGGPPTRVAAAHNRPRQPRPIFIAARHATPGMAWATPHPTPTELARVP